ncbi:MAG TPA: protein kinase [Planctomycetota bacterium]|nr:protein kinase [Planctomycetota bacterium]
MSDLIGKTVAGYPIEKQLGKGSYSTTWQATTSAAPLAVKLLRDDLRADSALNKAISYGWESTRQIQHPNLVVMFSAGVDPNLGAYCLEEVVRGKSLRDFILTGAKVAWRDCLILAEQLFGALQALHKGGRCHGDIWPSNILITQDQDLKLEGAGGLTLLDRLPTDVAQGPAVGYFAPENLQGSAPTHGSDIYAAGACIYFVMASRDPFPGDKGEAIARTVLEKKAPPLSAFRDDAPPEADEFIARLLAKDPTQRYGAVADILADIERMKAGKALAPLVGGKPAPAPTVRSVKGPGSGTERPKTSAGRDRLTPSPSGGTASGALRPAAASGLGLPRAGLSGTRAGVTGGALPAVAGASGLQRKASSGLSPAARSGTGIRVFGQLDTQVKSTIPQSDREKKGDDCYRQGQLPLALNCWKEAMETAPHTALKVKIELAERDIRKESFQLSLDEAKHRLLIGDYRGAISRAQEATLNADTDQQRQEAMKIEAEAGVEQQKAEGARKIKMIVGGVAGIILIVILAVVFGGKKDEPTPAQQPVAPAPQPQSPSGPSPSAPAKVAKVNLPRTDIYVAAPGDWTVSSNSTALVEMRAVPSSGGAPSVFMRISKIPAGTNFGTKFNDLRNKPPAENSTLLSNQEIFCWIDTSLQCGELGFSYNVNNKAFLRFTYLVGSPSGVLYQVDFEGTNESFTPQLQQDMRDIMRSWTYQKPK